MTHRILARLATATSALALTAGTLAVTGAPAQAAARITVTNDRGGNQADTTYQTPMTIRATGFQTIKGGFGGVYLMFGWVKPGGGWQPSRGGITGTDYKYIPDSEDATNKGYLKFIAFPGSSTANEAHAILSDSGSFQVSLTVPGPVFQSVDRDGNLSDVDCRKVTCGVITIGAHGVKNARNETFTPVRFGDVYGEEQTAPESESEAASPGTTQAPTAQPTPSTSQPTAQPSAGESAPSGTPTKAASVKRGKATLTTDRLTARAGSALAFTATGFQPGEQVLAILDDGMAALGPMIAGASGEVAGLLQLPADLRVGTHQLRLAGASSGAAPQERFPISGAATTATSSVTDGAAGQGFTWSSSRVFLALAAVVFVLALASTILTRNRRRGRARPLAPAAGSPA